MHTSTVHKMTRKGSQLSEATCKGWKLLCYWKDEYSVWVDLQHSKNFNPIYAAEYAVANKIQDEPAFKWWVPETLQSQNQINGKPKSRYCWKTSTIMAFGNLTQFKSLTDWYGNGDRLLVAGFTKGHEKDNGRFWIRQHMTPEQVWLDRQEQSIPGNNVSQYLLSWNEPHQESEICCWWTPNWTPGKYYLLERCQLWQCTTCTITCRI